MHLISERQLYYQCFVTVPVRVRIASGQQLSHAEGDSVTVPVRVRIASGFYPDDELEDDGYSPREGANCISKRIQFV